jgi:XTP/dITP diphosphohydrolase
MPLDERLPPMAESRTLVLGTHNQKKADELAGLLGPLGIQLITLADVPTALDVVEDGHTFAENAAKKACQQALHLKSWVLGEDSGLAVDALNGAPGVYSARFSGSDATDERNNDHLLQELGDTPLAKRTAHYVCHATLADPLGEVRAESEARCYGRIRFERAGSSGFGYDPLFEIPEYHRTFGELGPRVKACLSHRARAIHALVPQLTRLMASGQWPRS